MIFNEGLLSRFFYDAAKDTLNVHPLLYFGLLFVVLISAYLLGSINSAIIISRAVYHDDIRRHGSGNAGMTNMLRTYGKNAALLTLAGDLLKTVIALLIAALVFGFNYVGGISLGGNLGECYLAGLFAVLGHIFPLYYKFKGGKGVLATSTMALVLSPVPFLMLFLLFVLVVWLSKYVSLGSVTVAVLYPVVMHGYFMLVFSTSMPALAAISTIALAVIIVWCHRSNLVRIGNRTENKLSFGKKKDE
ncbi:MAG: glycerol-3-phosphate 1-O-acyltransferase PlsY [Clostridia bacterium]|nr:glycerol-3-phosphate 1-O-acyltransferase PlsY [Clostridia bacterium]